MLCHTVHQGNSNILCAPVWSVGGKLVTDIEPEMGTDHSLHAFGQKWSESHWSKVLKSPGSRDFGYRYYDFFPLIRKGASVQ